MLRTPIMISVNCASALAQFLKSENSFGELGPKREVVLNVFKGPESDYGGSKIRKDS